MIHETVASEANLGRTTQLFGQTSLYVYFCLGWLTHRPTGASTYQMALLKPVVGIFFGLGRFLVSSSGC